MTRTGTLARDLHRPLREISGMKIFPSRLRNILSMVDSRDRKFPGLALKEVLGNLNRLKS